MSQDFSALIPPTISQTIDEWIREDIPSIDRGAFVVGTQPKKATLFAKSNLVLAGVPFFDLIFKKFNVTVDWKYKEGSYIEASNNSKVPIAIVSGTAKDILQGERLALNVITRCCSIATNAKLFTDLKKKHNYKGNQSSIRC
jgi:nicotinate-nucleotide pyrophosphorylase (carboxylating)